MHHVFELDAILRLILCGIIDESPKNAVSFACCHKSFSAPTLDTVWGCQSDFTRLLQTLPSSAWNIVDGIFVCFSFTELFGRLWFSFLRALGRGMGVAFCIFPTDALFHGFQAHCALRGSFEAVECAFLRSLYDTQASRHQMAWCTPGVPRTYAAADRVASPHQFSVKTWNLWRLESFPSCSHLRDSRSRVQLNVEIRFCADTIHDPQIVHAASHLLLKCNPDTIRHFRVASALSAEAFIHATQPPNLESFAIRAGAVELGVPLANDGVSISQIP